MKKREPLTVDINSFVFRHKNLFFFSMCTMVHLASFCYYSWKGIPLMGVINLTSTFFYIYLLVTDFVSQKAIVLAYFEILIYSCISTLILTVNVGYILFSIGIIVVVVLMTDDYHHQHPLFISIGAITTTFSVPASWLFRTVFAEERSIIQPVINEIYSQNLVITLFTLMYTVMVYSVENSMERQFLNREASHDPLTGLVNRRYLDNFARLFSLEDPVPLSVMMCDIDHFKIFNDTYGHDVGDQALKFLASEMTSLLRSEDICCRWGGEEFVIILKDDQKNHGAWKAEELREHIEKTPFPVNGQWLSMTITIGVVSLQQHESLSDALKRADQKLYQGKETGRNRVIS